MKTVIRTTLLFSILSLMWGSAQAEININGFASVGGGFYSSDRGAGGYEGYDQDTFTVDPAMKFGVQLGAQVNEQVSATGQFLAKGDNDYNVEAEWAYLTYAASDELDVRVGRLRSPFFPYSDFLDVGYAYPWVTPPDLVYRFLFTTVEGIDLIYRTSMGMWDTTFQVYFGRLTDETRQQGEDVDIDLREFTGFNVTFNKDWLTLRASYNRADVTIGSSSTLQGLLDNLRGASFTSEADALEILEEDGAFWGVSAQVDYEDWLVNAEYTSIVMDEQSLISDDLAWYLMAGKRMEDLTLHVTYAYYETDSDTSILDGIPSAGPTAPLYAGASSLLADVERSSITLGMRYDFAPATALKVDLTRIDFESSDEEGLLLSFAIDTVF